MMQFVGFTNDVFQNEIGSVVSSATAAPSSSEEQNVLVDRATSAFLQGDPFVESLSFAQSLLPPGDCSVELPDELPGCTDAKDVFRVSYDLAPYLDEFLDRQAPL